MEKSMLNQELALLGGEAVVDRTNWPTWPPRLPGLVDALREIVEKDQWGVRSGAIQRFEAEFAKYHDAEFALAMMNGTMALIAALKALKIDRGDEVILPAYTFIASVTAIMEVGAIPIFADIDPETFNLDPKDTASRITPNTRAIMPVHVGGNPADLAAFSDLATKHGLVIIEDAAQAPGAVYNGTKVGAIGDAGCFSFQSSKNITSGEGGIFLTNHREIFEQAFEFYNCGRPLKGQWYEHVSPGLNMRISAFQAAVLEHQMPHLEDWAVTREANGRYLEEQLNAIPGITCAKRYPGTTRNAYHLFIFTYDSEEFSGLPKSRFLEALNAEGVVATEGYQPMYRAPFLWEDFRARGEDELPVTEHVCRNGVWIRQFELLAERSMMDGIAVAIRKVQANAQLLLESS
jgi:dTDP-4-amino-4,6-dideoxygalactose transaminase